MKVKVRGVVTVNDLRLSSRLLTWKPNIDPADLYQKYSLRHSRSTVMKVNSRSPFRTLLRHLLINT